MENNNKEYFKTFFKKQKNKNASCALCNWTEHCKEYASKNNKQYWQAIRSPRCKQQYHSKK